MMRILLFSLAAGLSASMPPAAQTLELRGHETVTGPVTTSIGDTVFLDVWARLDCPAVSGIDLHLSLPVNAFEVVDDRPDRPGVQPFSDGALFAPAMVAYNGISHPPGAAVDDRLHLRYSALAPAGSSGGLKGHGCVATFGVDALHQVDHAQVRIEDTPILETRLVLPDGTTERRFASLAGIELSVEHLATATRESSWANVKRAGAP